MRCAASAPIVQGLEGRLLHWRPRGPAARVWSAPRACGSPSARRAAHSGGPALPSATQTTHCLELDNNEAALCCALVSFESAPEHGVMLAVGTAQVRCALMPAPAPPRCVQWPHLGRLPSPAQWLPSAPRERAIPLEAERNPKPALAFHGAQVCIPAREFHGAQCPALSPCVADRRASSSTRLRPRTATCVCTSAERTASSRCCTPRR